MRKNRNDEEMKDVKMWQQIVPPSFFCLKFCRPKGGDFLKIISTLGCSKIGGGAPPSQIHYSSDFWIFRRRQPPKPTWINNKASGSSPLPIRIVLRGQCFLKDLSQLKKNRFFSLRICSKKNLKNAQIAKITKIASRFFLLFFWGIFL